MTDIINKILDEMCDCMTLDDLLEFYRDRMGEELHNDPEFLEEMIDIYLPEENNDE